LPDITALAGSFASQLAVSASEWNFVCNNLSPSGPFGPYFVHFQEHQQFSGPFFITPAISGPF
jgi:hypothetical protein